MRGACLDQDTVLPDFDAPDRMQDPDRHDIELLADLTSKFLQQGACHRLMHFVLECDQRAVFRMVLAPGRSTEQAFRSLLRSCGACGKTEWRCGEICHHVGWHRLLAYTPFVLEPSLPIAVFDLPPKQGLLAAGRLGFRGVTLSAAQPGLRPRELDRSARRGLLAELRRLELDCTSIDLLLPREHYQQAEHVDRALAATRQAIELADDLGARTVFLRLPPAGDDVIAGESGREVAAAAANARVRVVDVSLDGPAMAAFADGGELPVAVGMDTAAWLAEGEDPIGGIVRLDDRLGGVRLVDLDGNGTRVPVSMGRRIDLDAFRTGLEVGGFDGAVVLDARGWRDPVQGLVQDLEAWRALRPSIG